MEVTPIWSPSSMGYVILHFPKARKRGRKVTKGPKADVHVIYELDVPPAAPATPGLLNLDQCVEDLAQIVARRARESKRKRADMFAANPNITEFPASKRFRTIAEVRAHRDAHEGREDEPNAIADPLVERVKVRVAEILKENNPEGEQHES